jgi:hypothetical protein
LTFDPLISLIAIYSKETIKQVHKTVRKMIFSIKVFVTLLDYLKIPQVAILGDLHVERVLASSSRFLSDALTHPPSLLANQERL